MEYLVLHKLGRLSGISIEAPGGTYDHPIECWALDEGRKVLYARRQIVRDLATFHLGGRFENMSKYVMPFDELYGILTHRMGPCDRVRYVLAKEDHRAVPHYSLQTKTYILGRTLDTILFTCWELTKMLFKIVLFPFVIMFVNRHTKK